MSKKSFFEKKEVEVHFVSMATFLSLIGMKPQTLGIDRFLAGTTLQFPGREIKSSPELVSFDFK
jgi:hypothetical protein